MRCSTGWRGAWGQRGVEVCAWCWLGSREWANVGAGIQQLLAARAVRLPPRAGLQLPTEMGIQVLCAGGLHSLLRVPEDFPGTVLEHILKVIISRVSCSPLKAALQISGGPQGTAQGEGCRPCPSWPRCHHPCRKGSQLLAWRWGGPGSTMGCMVPNVFASCLSLENRLNALLLPMKTRSVTATENTVIGKGRELVPTVVTWLWKESAGCNGLSWSVGRVLAYS